MSMGKMGASSFSRGGAWAGKIGLVGAPDYRG